MTEQNAILRFDGMSRGKRTTERVAVATLLAHGFRRVGEPKLWVSLKRGFEEFQWTYRNESGEEALLKTRHPFEDAD